MNYFYRSPTSNDIVVLICFPMIIEMHRFITGVFGIEHKGNEHVRRKVRYGTISYR